jgi:hypothetical protein
VFLGTSVLMAAGAVYNWLSRPRVGQQAAGPGVIVAGPGEGAPR